MLDLLQLCFTPLTGFLSRAMSAEAHGYCTIYLSYQTDWRKTRLSRDSVEIIKSDGLKVQMKSHLAILFVVKNVNVFFNSIVTIFFIDANVSCCFKVCGSCVAGC